MDIKKIEEQTEAAINDLMTSMSKFLEKINAVTKELDDHTAQMNKAAAEDAKGHTRRPSFADIINKVKKR